MKTLNVIRKTLLIALSGSLLSTAIFGQQTQPIDIVFVDHLTAGLIEQDVFVQRTDGSDEVYRILPSEKDKYLNAPLYYSSEEIDHDPFNKDNIGPFPKGAAAGMTLGEWLAAKGTAQYKCEDGWGTFEATFSGLTPDGLYTMWHAFMAKNALVPFPGTVELPMGDRDGSDCAFRADKDGNATIKMKFDRCLQLTDIQLMTMVALAYHSDDKTYGVDAGPFGSNTHVPLFAILPEVSDTDMAQK